MSDRLDLAIVCTICNLRFSGYSHERAECWERKAQQLEKYVQKLEKECLGYKKQLKELAEDRDAEKRRGDSHLQAYLQAERLQGRVSK